ncbi:hypothetical protein AWJ20_2869 [Sugiyamaella lignohabitans]|uniref:Uncharacterized protein n=1 Tax=Sugiyamaella lignohabitans TaxID=796027 RepID=A0A167FFQ5_9ASCO|nr:uncharacterized protein AWJ20_2869 [Sugiyamaella lignohabitans]ANB15243.1 hypothetical protein AWJ20_2869 [Sugiyamaella lignohabitans]
MLVSGCSNSLLTKLQDMQCVGNCDAKDPKKRKLFEQPVFQTAQMFFAETSVWLMYWIMKYQASKSRRGYTTVDDAASVTSSGTKKLEGYRTLLLAIPSSLDLLATTLMNVGLLLVPVSIYQMTRGSVVLFVGSLSTIFLKHRITRKQWIGLFSVCCGVFLVGLSAAFDKKPSIPEDISGGQSPAESSVSWEVVLGVLLILFAQIFTASQFVVEEHILEKYSLEPIKVVAWEGIFGVSSVIIGSTLIYTLFGRHNPKLEIFDISEGVKQAMGNRVMVLISLSIMLSMAIFNICGLTVTNKISATSRSTIDTSRTLGIWIVSLLIGWEQFRFLQLVGFGLLVYGTLLFNGLIGSEPVVDPLPEEFEHS